MTAATTPLPEGFIPHDGGPCPVGAETFVEILSPSRQDRGMGSAWTLDWSRVGFYRVIIGHAEQRPSPAAPLPAGERGEELRERLDWPTGTFDVFDPDPDDDHGPIYLQAPCGLLVNFSAHAAPGVDAARLRWVTDALNDALRAASPAGEGEDPWGWLITYGDGNLDIVLEQEEADFRIDQADAGAIKTPLYPPAPSPMMEEVKAGVAAHMPPQEWLTRKVATDPDLDCEAGRPSAPSLEEVKGVLEPFPPSFGMLERTGCYWVIAKGRTRPDEPLYGVQIMDGASTEVEAQAEAGTLAEAIEDALAMHPIGAKYLGDPRPFNPYDITGAIMYFNGSQSAKWPLGRHADAGGYAFAAILRPDEREAWSFPKAHQASIIWRAMLSAATEKGE